MKRFLQRHAQEIDGVLSGFDRMRFRGTLRLLAHTAGMAKFLNHIGVLLKDFKTYVQGVTDRIRETTVRLAKDHGRPLIYLAGSGVSKEESAREIARRDGIEEGLVCVFSAVESCFSYEVHRDAQRHRLELQGRTQKCLHYYFYVRDPQFGFLHLRLQTWFPLTVHAVLNGREFLARQLDAAGLGYVRQDNCFVKLEDPERAQELCDQQLRVRWDRVLDRLIERFHPAHAEIFRATPLPYYWSLDQSEWATDVSFRSPEILAELYPALLRHAAYDFSSADVMRFLGRKTPAHGGVHGRFAGEAVGDVARRVDRLRIKHRQNGNWIKMYDKQERLLRVETTVNNVRDMQVFRRAEGQDGGKPAWRVLRKGVVDIRRRARISQTANERYLDGLAEVHATQSLGELTQSICQPAELDGRRVRALQPWSPHDTRLLTAISRPEFTLHGFRNKDLRPLLFDASVTTAQETRRRSAKISRQLRLLRAHGLILKIAHTHRYQLTVRGRTILTALQAARQANPEQLAKLVA